MSVKSVLKFTVFIAKFGVTRGAIFTLITTLVFSFGTCLFNANDDFCNNIMHILQQNRYFEVSTLKLRRQMTSTAFPIVGDTQLKQSAISCQFVSDNLDQSC